MNYQLLIAKTRNNSSGKLRDGICKLFGLLVRSMLRRSTNFAKNIREWRAQLFVSPTFFACLGSQEADERCGSGRQPRERCETGEPKGR